MNRIALAILAGAALSLPVLLHLGGAWQAAGGAELRSVRVGSAPETTVGINLFNLQWYNRQQVFSNLIEQSEWFQSRGEGWTPMPAGQIDRLGWITHLEPGQTAPRLLVLPPAPYRSVRVRCTFLGSGELNADGVAQITGSGPQSIELMVTPTGKEDEMGWIEITRTDPRDPLRDIDCRKAGTPPGARFDPDFLASVEGFEVLRFMDWQRTNDNARLPWTLRTLPESGTQAGPGGASVEDMVDLANASHADAWFTMPYHADEAYVRGFAQLVHDRLEPGNRVYVELGNEVWNTMFEATEDAKREGLARGLGAGNDERATMERYAERVTETMRIWTQVFADRPGALVRVCATQNANPAFARMVLEFRDTAEWVDALATAPYLWLDMEGYRSNDTDRVFAEMPGVIDRTFAMAGDNHDIAAEFGKRYITYEGGQHLVTRDLVLARAVQRDPRMGEVYTRYLTGWRNRFGDTMMLYASTSPISEYGAWGLREYGGQPIAEAPKLSAVRRFLEASR